MDYHALAAALRDRHGLDVDILDYAAVDADTTPAVRLAGKVGGRDAALATLGFARRGEYASIFSNGENVGVPLALLLGLVPRRGGHVAIGHRLSTRKKQFFFRTLKAQRRLDKVFVYARAQYDWGVDRLGLSPQTLALIPLPRRPPLLPAAGRPRQPGPHLLGGPGMAGLSDTDRGRGRHA